MAMPNPQKYLHKHYGWKPLSQVAADLRVSPRAVETMRGQWAVPSLFDRPGVMSVTQLAYALGISPTTLLKWAKAGAIPHKTGYRRDNPAYAFVREKIEHWLMRPKPSWMLVQADAIQDPALALILRNAQALNPFHWLTLQHAAERYYITDKGLLWHVKQGRISYYPARRRYWVWEPDVRRVLLGEDAGSESPDGYGMAQIGAVGAAI